MKVISFITRKIFLVTSLFTVILLSGCGINSGLINQFNVHGANTNVILQENNFKVVGTVSGGAKDTYILGFGGLTRDLVSTAKQNMIDNAELDGTSRAVINVTIEEHHALFVILVEKTIIAHGTVIEFTD
jgi:hypothetical protein